MRRLFEKIKEHLLHRFHRNPESITKQQQKHPTYNGYEDSPLRVLDSIHFMFRYIALLCGAAYRPRFPRRLRFRPVLPAARGRAGHARPAGRKFFAFVDR